MRNFKVRPKRAKRTNNECLSPDMEIIVTTKHNTTDPFYNGAEEIKKRYMDLYGFDYKKANCNKSDFTYEALD